MLYSFHELQRMIVRPLAELLGATAEMLEGQDLLPARIMRASCALLHRTMKDYRKPRFGLDAAVAHGADVAVIEHVLVSRPFCRLVPFTPSSAGPATATAHPRRPQGPGW